MSRSGAVPVQEFLDELKESAPFDHATVLVWQNCGIDAIIASRFPRRWATAYLSRAHVGKLNARIIWFFMKQRRIILVHGVRNKGQAIPACDFDRARERMRD